MILILIFGEALGLYGMIIAIILTQWVPNIPQRIIYILFIK